MKSLKSTSSNLYYISNLINAFTTNNPSSFQDLCRTHLSSSIDFMNFIEKGNKRMMIPAPNPISLPFTSRQTIIFDLD